MPEQPIDVDVPAIVVSSDSHVGPRVDVDLRPYCPEAYRAAYDEMVAAHKKQQAEIASLDPAVAERLGVQRHPNLERAGHYDPVARLEDMDSDGIAAEVMYHFSQNGEPMPWVGLAFDSVRPEQFELAAVAYRMYNRWLADFCAADPKRLLGLMYVPTWDIDASVEELAWGAEHGLRGVSFPPPSKPGVLEYNNPAWEPFWSACEHLGVSLHTHANGASHIDYMSGPGGMQIFLQENTGYMSRRGIWWLTYGRVFANHPALRLVLTEQTEGWFTAVANEMDGLYLTLSRGMGELPELPSFYLRQNVIFGASLLSSAEAQAASRDGWATNLIWGRDYPHLEGAYLAIDDPHAEPFTKRSLRHIFNAVPTEDALLMLGGNGVRELGLDGEHLQAVANRIGALTPRQLSVPLDDVPDVGSLAFVGYSGSRPVDQYRREWSERRKAERPVSDAALQDAIDNVTSKAFTQFDHTDA